MTLQQLYLVLLAGGLVLLASIVATRAASRVGLPSLLLFLGVGVIVGEDGLGLHFDNYLLADHLGTVALAIILVEGGLTTRFSDVRKVLAPAAALATVGRGCQHGGDRRRRAPAARDRLATGTAARRRRFRHRRRRRVLGAARRPPAPPGGGPARGRVRIQRRPGRHSRPDVQRDAAGAVSGTRARRTGLRVVRRRRDRVGLRTTGLNRLAPHRSSRFRPVSAGDLRARHGRVRRRGQRPRQRVPRRVSGRRRARQLRATPPLGHPVVRGGTRLAGADRPVRPARPARRSQRSGRRVGAGRS